MLKSLEERVAVLENEIKKIKRQNFKNKKLSKLLGVGDTFELARYNWKILEITEEGYKCLADRLDESMEFDSNSNDWRKSQLREYLNNNFFDALGENIDKKYILPFHRDLMSLDGQIEYGTCTDKVSLLTVDEYRKYRDLIPNPGNYWWWTCTPWSTPCNNYETSVTVVSYSGFTGNYSCHDDCGGVRPFCIFSSEIFVSKGE